MPPRNRRLNKDGSDPFGTAPLPFDLPKNRGAQEGAEAKKRWVKPEDYGKCPKCSALKVALMKQGDHLVWKEHTFATYGKARFTCAASGQRLCDLPEGEPALHYGEPMACTCRPK